MTKNNKVTYLVRLALLTAIIIFMTVTPFGYLYIGPLAVTFLTVPVIIGAITMGEGAGAFLGLVFGITSFANAFKSAMGITFMTINPFYTFVLCVVPRILEGYLCGLIFKLLNKKRENKVWKITLSSLSCPVLNTILYMSTLILLFGNSEYVLNLRAGKNIFAFVAGFVGVQAVVEAVVCTIVGSAISTAVLKYLKSAR